MYTVSAAIIIYFVQKQMISFLVAILEFLDYVLYTYTLWGNTPHALQTPKSRL